MSEKKLPSLDECREKIDRIDRELVNLFRDRMEVAADVAEYTRSVDMPVTDTPILHHHDDKLATITDNEIKNSADHTTNKYNQTRYAENEPATPQPDIIATAPIEQEHISVLLAENETQIEIEQNLVADTAYMIADAEPIYNNLEMYCSTRCSSNEVSMMYFNTMGKI